LGTGITQVFATVIPPDFDPTREISDWSEFALPQFELVKVPGEDQEYAGDYDGFTMPGDYTIVLDAENIDGGAIPVRITVAVPRGGEMIKGDVNGDGRIRSNDAILTLRIAAELAEPDEYQKQLADMNNDGKVRSNDAILILRKAAGLTASTAQQ